VMDRIIRAVEVDENFWTDMYEQRKASLADQTHAIATSARDIARVMKAKALFAFTRSGGTAFASARERARCPLFGLTPQVQTARQLSLVWGVTSVVSPDFEDSDAMHEWAEGFAKQALDAEAGEAVISLSGAPVGVPGSTNNLRIMTVK